MYAKGYIHRGVYISVHYSLHSPCVYAIVYYGVIINSSLSDIQKPYGYMRCAAFLRSRGETALVLGAVTLTDQGSDHDMIDHAVVIVGDHSNYCYI